MIFLCVLEFDVYELLACDSVRCALTLAPCWCIVEPVNEREQRSEEHSRKESDSGKVQEVISVIPYLPVRVGDIVAAHIIEC